MLIGKREKISDEKAKKLENFAIIVLVIFAIVSYFLTNYIFKSNKNDIIIYVDGQQITESNGHKIDININGIYTIGDKNGDYNIIEIKDKKIRCIEANCPDKICVAHGELRSDIDNDMIVCAPHKMSIQYR